MKKIYFLCIILSSTSILSQFKIKGSCNADIEFNTKLSLMYTLFSNNNYYINSVIGFYTFPFHSINIYFFENYFLPFQIEINRYIEVRNFDFILNSSSNFYDFEKQSETRK